MFNQKINTIDLSILKLILNEKLTISQIAIKVNRSLSWTSECVNHLEEIGLIDIEKNGISKFVSISSNPVGESFKLLLTETSYLNLDKILSNSGLTMLPLLLRPGSSIEEFVKRTLKSARTVNDTIKRWCSLGIVNFDKNTKLYSFNNRYQYLIQFAIEYSKYSNKFLLREEFPKAIIVWQWRDEFLFTTIEEIKHPKFLPAAVTQLNELGFDFIHTSNYYFYSRCLKKVSKEEAFIQTIKTNLDNPRIIKIITEAIINNKIKTTKLLHYATKYGLKTRIKKEVLK